MDNYFVRMHQYFGEKNPKKQELENTFLDAEDATLTVRWWWPTFCVELLEESECDINLEVKTAYFNPPYPFHSFFKWSN